MAQRWLVFMAVKSRRSEALRLHHCAATHLNVMEVRICLSLLMATYRMRLAGGTLFYLFCYAYLCVLFCSILALFRLIG